MKYYLIRHDENDKNKTVKIGGNKNLIIRNHAKSKNVYFDNVIELNKRECINIYTALDDSADRVQKEYPKVPEKYWDHKMAKRYINSCKKIAKKIDKVLEE